MKVGDDLYSDDPNSLCFGCGHHTPTAFCLRSSTPVGHRADAKCEAPARMCGAPNVVHGGIQATLLDAADNVLTTSQARWLRLESSYPEISTQTPQRLDPRVAC